MRTVQSEKYFKRAKEVLVAGVNSPVRSFNSVGGNPLVMKYGKGSSLFDYDNNQYTDYCLSWGALILGHAHRNPTLAAKKTAEKGTSFGTTTREEVEMAEFIVGAVPSIERIRFVNSGTEATMSAIRLARGYTKRDLIIKFDGCYHGHVDDLLTTAGSGVANLNESSSQGIPQAHMANTMSLPYNDIDLLSETIKKYSEKIACVILEPVAGNMGVIPAQKEFLKNLRDLTSKFGIVLIFDEIMTGFRTNIGCVQTDYGIIPDMTCLGKIIGGGFPIGSYGGKKEIMDCLAPLGGVYQAGTFSGNPVVMRTGLASLKYLSPEFYKKLNLKCEGFANALNAHFKKEKVDLHLSHYKSMMNIRFREKAVLNYKDAQDASSSQRYGKLFNHLLESNIYWPPADLEAFFVSGMHTQSDLNNLLSVLKNFRE